MSFEGVSTVGFREKSDTEKGLFVFFGIDSSWGGFDEATRGVVDGAGGRTTSTNAFSLGVEARVSGSSERRISKNPRRFLAGGV